MSTSTAQTSVPSSSRAGALCVLAAAALWGSTGTVSTFAPDGVPPTVVGSSGLALGGLLLCLTGRLAGAGPAARGRREYALLVLGAGTVAGYPLTFFPAVARAGVAPGTVIMLCCAPVCAGLLDWLLRRHRPHRRWVLATAGCLAGAVLLAVGGDASAHLDPVGILLAVVAGASYAAYTAIAGLLISRGRGSAPVTGAMFGGGALIVLPVQLAAGPSWMLHGHGPLVVAHLALVTTFLAYVLYGRGLRTVTAAVATTLALAEPAVATVLGVLVLHERLAVAGWVGEALLAAALLLLAVGQRAPASTAR